MRKQICRFIAAVSCLMLFSLVATAQRSRASVPASEVNGTFRHSFAGIYKGSSSEIKILALGGGKLHIAMDLIYPYTMLNGDLMANTGQLDEKFAIDGDIAVFKTAVNGTCRIQIKFVAPGTIKVVQDGVNCGFGNRVTSSGTYKRVSSAKPKFDAPK